MKTMTSQAVPGNDENDGGPVIHFPTKAESDALLTDSLRKMHANRAEHRLAAVNGIEALPRLVDVMRYRTGQGFKLRRLLFSLWSGTPGADLSDVVCFDWAIRRDLCRVLLGWGFEDATTKFFYTALEQELKRAGLMEWFREEGGAS